MKTTSIVLSLSVSILSMLVPLSCNQSPASGDNKVKSEQNSEIIASLDFENGGSVEFYESEPGCLVTAATFSSLKASAPYKGLNPVELYEALSGSDAPARLVAAYQRARDSAKTQSKEPPPPDFRSGEGIKESDAAGVAKTQMDANEFVMTYCMSMGEVDYGTCMWDQEGSSSWSCWAAEMYNYVHSEDGAILFKTQWWDSNQKIWRTMNSQWVYAGQTKSYSFVGITRYRKVSVSNATGKHYHYVYYAYEVAQ